MNAETILAIVDDFVNENSANFDFQQFIQFSFSGYQFFCYYKSDGKPFRAKVMDFSEMIMGENVVCRQICIYTDKQVLEEGEPNIINIDDPTILKTISDNCPGYTLGEVLTCRGKTMVEIKLKPGASGGKPCCLCIRKAYPDYDGVDYFEK